MPYFPYLYEFSPLYLAQAALTIWMLVDASRRGVEYYWFWIILVFQPIGPWAYFFLYKFRDFSQGRTWLAGLFHRRPSLDEVRYRTEQAPTLANRLELAGRLCEIGDHAEAVPNLEAVLAREPTHCQALFLLGQAHRHLGQPGQAVPLLRKLVGHHPAWNDYAAWHALVAVCRESGDLTGAVTHCRELARTAPNLEHRCLLAEHLLATGEKGEARKVVQQGLDGYRYLTGPSRRRDRPWVGKAKQLLRESD
jgi:hypothetical protein